LLVLSLRQFEAHLQRFQIGMYVAEEKIAQAGFLRSAGACPAGRGFSRQQKTAGRHRAQPFTGLQPMLVTTFGKRPQQAPL
jgi:hypothetical protein